MSDLTTIANGIDRRTDLQKYVDKKVLERVKAGMVLLQLKYGDNWVEHIDPEKFDMAQDESCVLGQVCRHDPAFTAKNVTGDRSPYGWAHINWEIDPSDFGFDTYDESYEELQWVWLKVFEDAGVDGAADLALQIEEGL